MNISSISMNGKGSNAIIKRTSTKRLKTLIRDLSHADPSKRYAAAEALSCGDERALYPLIKALRDENSGVQDAAMRSLISLGGEVTAYMVIPLLRELPYLRNTAMIILKAIGTASIPSLHPLLSDKDDDVRKFAIDLISDIGYCPYIDTIVNLLGNDPNPNVRVSAAKALGILRYSDSIPQLISALKDDEWVCFAAIEALALLKDESSTGAIALLLDNTSDPVRIAAIETLGAIGTSVAADALLSHLPKAEGYEKSLTVKNLVTLGVTPKAVGTLELLMEMLSTGEWDEKLVALKGIIALEAHEAVYAILDTAGSLEPSDPETNEKLDIIKGALGSLGSTEFLIRVLENPSLRFRGKMLAIEVIGDLRCRAAVPYLLQFLDKDVRDVRRASIKALVEIDTVSTQKMIRDALEDHDGHVRRTAIAALGRIGDTSVFEMILRQLTTERYRDVTEEAVKTLLMLDEERVFSHLDEFDSVIRESICNYAQDFHILQVLARDWDLRVKASAIAGLGRMRDERAHCLLTEAIHDEEPEIRKAAVKAMGELICCHDEIRAALRDEDMWVRLYAVEAIGRASGEDTLDALVPMLEDRSFPVVLTTIDAISHIGGERAFSILESLSHHDQENVRTKAYEALKRIPS